jgi:two-component system chemotaxis response regulator CheB
MLREKTSPIRVVVVDDSATTRELMVGLFQSSQDFEVIGFGSTGLDAIRLVNRLHPDIAVIDIRMPKMDGLEATKLIMSENPTPIVMVSGSRTPQEMDLTFKALQAGALTVINKPGLDDPEACEKMVRTVQLMADVPVIHHWGHRGKQAQSSKLSTDLVSKVQPVPLKAPMKGQDLRVIGIAASTGGPSALATVLGGLPKDFPIPILAVQHITTGFTNGLADWLDRQTQLEVRIAAHGDKLQSGLLLLAPDDHHLKVSQRGIVELSQEPLYKGLRPSANYLFHSLAQVYGHYALGIILTGMGDDGADGIQALYKAGGYTIAQDEQSSVVYGMPRQAAALNAIHHVLGLDRIAVLLEQLKYSGDSSA